MKRSLRFALCIATVVFLTVVPAELLAHRSGDPKLDRAVEKANSEFVAAMKTGDGYGEIGVLKDGKLSINGGRFLTVWQRQANGDWKILRNIVLP